MIESEPEMIQLATKLLNITIIKMLSMLKNVMENMNVMRSDTEDIKKRSKWN